MGVELGQKVQQAVERYIFLPMLIMWIWPRTSVRELMSRDSRVAVLVLAGLGGVFLTLLLVTFRAPGVRVLLHPAVILAIGVVVGIGGLYLGGWLVALLGRLFGVQATTAELRRALAWTTLPAISVMVLVAGTWLWMAWGKSFYSSLDVSSYEKDIANWIVPFSPVGIWGFVILVLAIAEALRIELPKAFVLVGLFGASVFGASVGLADFLHIQVPSMAAGGMSPFTNYRVDRLLVVPAESLSRGDVVSIKHTRQDRKYGELTNHTIGRVIGLPGDVVGMTDGVLSLNGQAIRRRPSHVAGGYLETLPGGVSYIAIYSHQFPPTFPETQVGADQVYVLADARDYGYGELFDGTRKPHPVPPASTRLIARDQVAGKVLLPPLPESLARWIR